MHEPTKPYRGSLPVPHAVRDEMILFRETYGLCARDYDKITGGMVSYRTVYRMMKPESKTSWTILNTVQKVLRLCRMAEAFTINSLRTDPVAAITALARKEGTTW